MKYRSFIARLVGGPMDGAEFDVLKVEPELNIAYIFEPDDMNLEDVSAETSLHDLFPVLATYRLVWQFDQILNYQYTRSRSTAGSQVKSVKFLS